MMTLADAARCAGDAVCLRVHALEPQLPIAPDWTVGGSSSAACPASVAGWCVPWIHLLGSWHSFLDEAVVEPLKRAGTADVRRSCFYDWKDDRGAALWPASFGQPQLDRPLMATCGPSFQWYPAFAGRYHSVWAKSYGLCKPAELAKRQKGDPDYYSRTGAMWQICRPEALRAHDAATGTGGAGAEATPPFVLRAVYGPAGVARARILAVVRNPTDRFEAAYWIHTHYRKRCAQPSNLELDQTGVSEKPRVNS